LIIINKFDYGVGDNKAYFFYCKKFDYGVGFAYPTVGNLNDIKYCDTRNKIKIETE
jgi:hypothetical protein